MFQFDPESEHEPAPARKVSLAHCCLQDWWAPALAPGSGSDGRTESHMRVMHWEQSTCIFTMHGMRTDSSRRSLLHVTYQPKSPPSAVADSSAAMRPGTYQISLSAGSRPTGQQSNILPSPVNITPTRAHRNLAEAKFGSPVSTPRPTRIILHPLLYPLYGVIPNLFESSGPMTPHLSRSLADRLSSLLPSTAGISACTAPHPWQDYSTAHFEHPPTSSSAW
jgi:hypothetical protein